MNAWKTYPLSFYYWTTLQARRRAAVERAATQTEVVRVVFYHRVADDHPNDWTISTKAFRQHIDWLESRFDIVSLEEAQRRIATRRNRWPTACITFDDGYADNFDTAIPLLLEKGLPFTYFVTSNHVFTGEPFPHDVEAGQPLAPNTFQQVRELASEGVEIGSHAKSHADLGRARRDHLVDEIVGSKHDLERMLNREVRYFAFPFGRVENMPIEAVRIATEAGYRGVCSAYGGYNFPGDDPLHIARFHGDEEMIQFVNWMTIDPRKVPTRRRADVLERNAAGSDSQGSELPAHPAENEHLIEKIGLPMKGQPSAIAWTIQ